MPGLLTLTTNLKSLKYGQDQPGGGDSGQPYIQTDINNPVTPLNSIVRAPFIRDIIGEEVSNNIGAFIDRFVKVDDGLVRGGILGSTNAAITDTLRINKFLYTDVKGPLFIIKQVGLQLSNPRLEVPKTLKGALTGGIISAATNGLLQPTRIYNLGINTIAQVPVNAFGGHFNRHGLLPIQTESSKYEAIVKANNNDQLTSKVVNTVSSLLGVPLSLPNNPSRNNRLVKLLGELQLQSFVLPTISVKTAAGPSELAEASGTSNFIYKDTKTGQTYKSSDISSKDPRLISGQLQSVGIEGRKTLGEVVVKSQKIKIIKEKKDGVLKISPGENIPSLSYLGGPNSVYGIGFTNIKRYSLTNYKHNSNRDTFNSIAKSATQNLTRLEATDSDTSKSSYVADLGLSLLDSRLIKFIENNDSVTVRDNTVVEYTSVVPSLRKYVELRKAVGNEAQPKYFNIEDRNENIGKAIQGASPIEFISSSLQYSNTYGDVYIAKGFNNWSEISRENRIGDFGKAQTHIIRKDGTGYTKDVPRADSINLTPIFDETSYWADDKIDVGDGIKHNIRDLAKFKIQAVDTDKPGRSNHMVFRAYITQLSDNVDAQWSDIKYAGRGNPFYIYTGFTRKVQVGFKVAALSAYEMRPMYAKLNYLMASLMPDYSGVLMRGPLHRLTIGNYFDSQLGILNSLSYTVPNDSPWEIAIDEPEGGTAQLILPHVLEVSMTFTPIGAETGVRVNGTGSAFNKLEAKSPNDDISFIAQNTTGNDKGYVQYYGGF